jgi:hypothetical protein
MVIQTLSKKRRIIDGNNALINAIQRIVGQVISPRSQQRILSDFVGLLQVLNGSFVRTYLLIRLPSPLARAWA